MVYSLGSSGMSSGSFSGIPRADLKDMDSDVTASTISDRRRYLEREVGRYNSTILLSLASEMHPLSIKCLHEMQKFA